MSIIISVFESLVVSGVDRIIAEKWKDKKRDKQLQEAYNAWLENEKSHMHYNALDRALSNSNIIGEFIASVCCPEKNFTMKSRIEDLFRHDNFTTEEKTHISHSVETLQYSQFVSIKNKHTLCKDLAFFFFNMFMRAIQSHFIV